MIDERDEAGGGSDHAAAMPGAIDDGSVLPLPDVRDAIDARDSEQLRRNPSDEDAKLEVALDETFPGSDSPSNTQPGKGKDPAPSSGYDPAAEEALANKLGA